MHKGTVI